MTAQSVKTGLNACKQRLQERTEKMALFGYQSKERISKSSFLTPLLLAVMDEEIKGMFKNCEDELAYLREVFRKYQEKNKRKLS